MRGIAVLVAMSIMLMVLISCQLLGGGGGGGILPPIGGGGGSGGGGIVRGSGNIANDFGSLLGKDIDGDGDVDSAVLMDQIHNIYEGRSIFVSNTGVYVAGNGGNVWGYVLKLDYNGNVVNNFGGITIGNGAPQVQGMVTFQNIVGGNYGVDLAEDVYVSGGSVYVVGYSAYDYTNTAGVVIKMDENNGTLDSNFGTNGVKLIDDVDGTGADDMCRAVYVEGSNMYVAIDSGVYGGYLYVKKLDAGNGNEIGSSQRLDKIWPVGAIGDKVEIEDSGDGNLIVGATGSPQNSVEYIYISKLNKNSLGVQNEKRIMSSDFSNFGSYDTLYLGDLHVSGGKVYVVGTLYLTNIREYDIALMKLNISDLSYDSSFGVGGKLVFDNIDTSTSSNTGNSIWVDSQGRIYVVGSGYKIYVLRLDSNGNIDSSFGVGGKLVLDYIGSSIIDQILSMFMYGGSLYMTGRNDIGGLALRMDNLQ